MSQIPSPKYRSFVVALCVPGYQKRKQSNPRNARGLEHFQEAYTTNHIYLAINIPHIHLLAVNGTGAHARQTIHSSKPNTPAVLLHTAENLFDDEQKQKTSIDRLSGLVIVGLPGVFDRYPASSFFWPIK